MRDQARQGVRLAAVFAGALLGVLAFASQATAVTISADSDENVFAGGPFSQAAGTKATFSNPGPPNATPHNVFADPDLKGPDGGPLFFTPLIVSPGASSPVRGTEYLTRGSYRFRCTLHTGMDGVLEVTSGSPAPRPKLKTKIRSRSLNAVRQKRKVEIGLRADRATGPVKITVKAKGRVLAKAGVPSLPSGKARNLSARLTTKGRKAIAKGRSVKFQVTAVAEFASPSKTSKVLRGRR